MRERETEEREREIQTREIEYAREIDSEIEI